jgi:hypothetical protein
MNMRKYSINEIDQMRRHVEYLVLPVPGGCYTQADIGKEVESRLRAYMDAGIDPADLAAKASARSDFFVAQEVDILPTSY